MKFNYPIGLISNKNAKKNKKNIVDCNRLVEILGGPKKCILRETSTLDELSQALVEFAEKRIEIVLSNGGDGTHQRLINTILHEQPGFTPYFVPLKSGTMNMLPRNLGLNYSPYKVAEWVKKVLDGKVDPYHVIKNILEIDPDPQNPALAKRYGFVFLSGCAYNLLKLYYSFARGGRYNAIRSILWSLISYPWGNKLARKIYSYTPSEYEFDNKDKKEFPYLITIASGLEKLVLGFSPFAGRKKQDDSFYVMIDGEPMIRSYNPLKFFRLTDKEKWKGKRLVGRTKLLRVDVQNGFSVDGELIPVKNKISVLIKKGPKVRFLSPGV
jgi:diacylglycerol kinase (ATP)